MTMAKKRRKPKSEPGPAAGPSLDDLVAMAEELKLPAEQFDGDLRDAADDEADMIYENARGEDLRGQLEFLYSHGWGLGRLADLIRERAAEPIE